MIEDKVLFQEASKADTFALGGGNVGSKCRRRRVVVEPTAEVQMPPCMMSRVCIHKLQGEEENKKKRQLRYMISALGSGQS